MEDPKKGEQNQSEDLTQFEQNPTDEGQKGGQAGESTQVKGTEESNDYDVWPQDETDMD